MGSQLALFADAPLAFDAQFTGARRERLDFGAWVEIANGWLSGDGPLFELLRTGTDWQADRRQMYERMVNVPRLTARFPEHGDGHPILWQMADALTARYDQSLHAISAAYYRDGRDSVALHGDRVGRWVDDCVIAIVSLGEPRRFLLKPARGGRSRLYRLGYGDLLVMGGSCQRHWQHGVPKAAHAGPRISVQFRPPALSETEGGARTRRTR